MKILAIETSCDETGVAVVEVSGQLPDVSCTVLGNALQSQIDVHKEYGGVFPALAKREHSKNFVTVLKEAMQQIFENSTPQNTSPKKIPHTKLQEIQNILQREPELLAQLVPFLESHDNPGLDGVAVTVGPGLEPALWVGINAARALATAWDVPIVAVNHMEGHIVAALVTQQRNFQFSIFNFQFPAVVLLVSGGHTELLLMKDWFVYERLGETRDDAAGEAFDKSARMMGLPYPGGPEISKLAREAREEDLAQSYTLPRPMLHSSDFDFSYSGLKNAVRLLLESIGQPTPQQQRQIAREVEDAIVETLVAKARRALQEHAGKTLIVSGGVSANAHLKTELAHMTQKEGVVLAISTPELATDNGLMIALAGALRALHGEYVQRPDSLTAQGNLTLGTKIVF